MSQLDVFSLCASITLNPNDFNTNLDKAQKKFKSFSDNISGLSNKIDSVYKGVGDALKTASDGFRSIESVGQKAASGLTAVLKALAGATTIAAGGLTAVGKSAFDSYADYEQLVGGVETLFKGSSETVMNYADNAYKTAGMSANQYMELTTSFAASLLQSLGGDTEKAAKMADMAASDMADNWNKMGSDMRSVTDAYKGFAKQNYTMLDNLKLGYGGTKEEMQRLLADAEKFSGIKYDLSSYADIISAIHVIQEEMEITGTTAKEASTTIQGSVQSMKGAWENFKVGIADSNQSMKRLTDNLIGSVVTAGNNVVQRIQEIVNQIVRVGPEVIRGFFEIIPEFARMGGKIVKTLVDGLSTQVPALLEFGAKAVGWIADGISSNAHKVAGGIIGLISGIATMIGNNSNKLVSAGEAILGNILRVFNSAGYLINKYIGDFIPIITHAFVEQHEALFRVGMEILSGIGKGLVENKSEIGNLATESIASMVIAFRDNAPMIIEGGFALLEALVGAITENLPLIIETGATIIRKLIEGIATASTEVQAIIGTAVLPHILKIIEVVGGIGGAVLNVASLAKGAIDTVISIGSKLIGGIQALWGLLAANPIALVVAAIAGLVAAFVGLWNTSEDFRNFWIGLWESLKSAVSTAADVIIGLFNGFIDFIKNNWQGLLLMIVNPFAGAFKLIYDNCEAFRNFVDGLMKSVGDMFAAGWEAVKSAWSAASGFFSGLFSGIKDAATAAGSAIGGALSKAWDAVTSAWNGATGFFSGIWDGIKDVFSNAWNVFTDIGGNIVKGIWNGITSLAGWLRDKITGFFSGIVNGVKSFLGIHSPSTVFAGIGGNMALGLSAGWDNEYNDIKRRIEGGLNFGTATVGVNATARYGAQDGAGRAGNGWGDTYVTINSPVAVDGVQAAREWQKTAQRMALGYV